MLSMWFVHDGGSTQDWRLKGHARRDFWRWCTSWGALVKRPSDLGYDDAAYALPPLETREIMVASDLAQARRAGLLFVQEVSTLEEQRAARRASLDARVAAAAELVAAEPDEQWLLWCDLNDEGDALEKAMSGAVQIRGADSPESKESRILDFAEGRSRVLVTKPSIAGAGVNLQRCARIVFVGIGHSFEAYYQAVRRCWRFGQTRPVHCYVVTSEAEGRVLENLRRKQQDAERMSVEMSRETADLVRAELGATKRDSVAYEPKKAIQWPAWLREEAS
jgi:superfamily II DNA or RNA helicase